jgi:hypothetical protein
MTTALSFIQRSLRLANVVGDGQTPSSEDAANGLEWLNDMLDSWSAESLMVYAQVPDVVTLTAGQSVYTIGAGGDFNIARPVRLRSVTQTVQGVTFPVDIINQDEYDTITLRTLTQQLTRYVLYTNSAPLGTLTFWPTPSATISATLWSDEVLSSVPSLTTDLVFPPGYSEAIRTNLALRFCMEYGLRPSAETVALAAAGRARIKKANRTPTVSEYDTALIGAPGGIAGFLAGY